METPNTITLPLQQSPTTLISSTSLHETCEEPVKPPPPAPSKLGRSHQRSRTTVDLPPLFTNPSRSSIFLPFRSTEKNHSPTTSPPRSPTHEVDDLDFADEERSGIRLEPKSNKLTSWFTGTSQPITIGLLPSPAKEQADPLTDAEMFRQEPTEDNLTRALTSKGAARSHKSSSSSPTRPPLMASTSKFSFFKSKTMPNVQPSPGVCDELTGMDINHALFPMGPGDEFSPAAFKNLHMNAEGTLKKFQSAYAQALQALREITSERNVQADELEAAQTRNEHLKLQLTDMAEKAIEQERALKQMVEDLAAERQKRVDEEAFRKRTLKMVPSETEEPLDGADIVNSSRENRISNASLFSGSEVESALSSEESIFSQGADLSRATSCASPTPTTPFAMNPETVQDKSPRQLFSSSADRPIGHPPRKPLPGGECQICHGMQASEAWEVVSVLREESKALKETIAQMEAGLDSSLDFVAGLI